MTDKPPALEGTICEQVTEHIRALHATRKAYTGAESSKRICRALHKQIRTLDNFGMGDAVYFKQADGNEWQGPGEVIGQDGTVVFVNSYGLGFVRVY